MDEARDLKIRRVTRFYRCPPHCIPLLLNYLTPEPPTLGGARTPLKLVYFLNLLSQAKRTAVDHPDSTYEQCPSYYAILLLLISKDLELQRLLGSQTRRSLLKVLRRHT